MHTNKSFKTPVKAQRERQPPGAPRKARQINQPQPIESTVKRRLFTETEESPAEQQGVRTRG
jgi:hypothetical protein